LAFEIKGFTETSFLDWDGKIVSTVYVPLCNFRCPFCHNSGLIENPAQYENVPIEHVLNFLKERKDFLDGVCITGGEPGLHKNNGLFEFMETIRDLGFKIKFDTNGTDPDLIGKMINENLVDYIAMDLKGPLDDRYYKLIGVRTDLNDIKKSIKLLMRKEIDYEFRTTVVPTLLDTNDIEDMTKYIKGAHKLALQQFVPENCLDISLRDKKPYSVEKLNEMLSISKKYVNNTILRGIKDLR